MSGRIGISPGKLLKRILYLPAALGLYLSVEYKFIKYSGVTELTLQTLAIVALLGGWYPEGNRGVDRENRELIPYPMRPIDMARARTPKYKGVTRTGQTPSLLVC